MLFNPFRVIADLSHVLSKIILMWSIHWNRSAEGVSLITQVLYILVFLTRYLDLFDESPFADWIRLWNFCFKIFYISSSIYIVFLMSFVYARTRERERAWKFGMYCLAGAAILAMPMTKIFAQGPEIEANWHLWSHPFRFKEILWVFSEILESVCVLPQLLLLRQTTVPTVIDSYYLVTLGSYRGFYILNWIIRVVDKNKRHFDPISVIFGIIQTALYLDFAWVYYSRQRVKLRAGGIVDSDDFERGWLVNRLIGKHGDGDEESAPAATSRRKSTNRWGARGISVSADDHIHDVDGQGSEAAQPLTDPNVFEDELTDDEEDAPPRREQQGEASDDHNVPSDPWAEDDRK